MIQSRQDLLLRILDEIAFLAARLSGLQAMGMTEDVLKEVERLEQASGQLDPDGRKKADEALAEIRRLVQPPS